MKTTLVIDDGVMRRLKEEAAREGTTISKLVEAALRKFLRGPDSPKSESMQPLPSFDGGLPEVDIADRDALYEVMESGASASGSPDEDG